MYGYNCGCGVTLLGMTIEKEVLVVGRAAGERGRVN